jgi:hypothetical protein
MSHSLLGPLECLGYYNKGSDCLEALVEQKISKTEQGWDAVVWVEGSSGHYQLATAG